MDKEVYKKEHIKKILTEKFDKEYVSYETDNKYGNYIDYDFSTVFECICETIEELTGNTIE
jgi:hypothetical protein